LNGNSANLKENCREFFDFLEFIEFLGASWKVRKNC
jgi:hypothetical protein